MQLAQCVQRVGRERVNNVFLNESLGDRRERIETYQSVACDSSTVSQANIRIEMSSTSVGLTVGYSKVVKGQGAT